MIRIFFLLCGLCFSFGSQGQSGNCAEIRMDRDVPTLFVNGEREPHFAYMSYLGKGEYYREMADSKIRIFNVPAYLGDQGINSTSGIGVFRPSLWVDSARYNLSSLKKDLDEIIASSEEALIIIRIHLDPPKWWEKKNPDEMCRLPEGKPYRVSFFSEKWRTEAGRVLESIVRELMNSRYSRNLLGIHVAGGMTEEWFYHYKDHFYDDGPARKSAFRKWLKNRYGHSVSRLRNAWGCSGIDFGNAVPEDISGQYISEGWRDSVKDRSWFDTFDFQAENMVENIEYFSQIVKEVSRGCLLTGAFYGYHYFVFQPQRGHGALAKLLESPYIDYLSSPNDYKREIGMDWPPMAAVGSVQMHGKLWLAENDTRTYLTTLLKEKAPDIDPGGEWYTRSVWKGPESKERSHALVLKNLGRMLSGGYGGWWFDMWGGWFGDSTMMSIIEKGVDAWPLVTEPGIHLEAEVVVVVDERLSFRDKSFGRQTGHIMQNKYALGVSGAPYDLFLRTDMEQLTTRPYKMIWLLGVPELSVLERKLLRRWKSLGKVVLHTDLHSTAQYGGVDVGEVPGDKTVFSAEEIARIWRSAGVHMYTSSGSVIYAGNRWVTIHSATGGVKILHWPGDYEVENLMNGEVIPSGNRTSRLEMEPGETYLFEIKSE